MAFAGNKTVATDPINASLSVLTRGELCLVFPNPTIPLPYRCTGISRTSELHSSMECGLLAPHQDEAMPPTLSLGRTHCRMVNQTRPGSESLTYV